MKLFKSNIEILKRSAPAKMGRRFLAGVVDMLLVVFVAVLIMQGTFAITSSMDGYKAASATVDSEIKYYNDLVEEAHVVEFIEGERLLGDTLAYKNVIRAIYRSYSKFGNQNFDFETIYEKSGYTKEALKNEILSSGDNLALFYTDYLPANDPKGNIISMIGKTPEEVLLEAYKEKFGDDYFTLFKEDENDKLPILKEDAAFLIFHYLFENETDPNGERGKGYYDVYINAYCLMLEDAEDAILRSEPYYSEHYLIYRENQSIQARYMNITLIISIFISCLIVLLLPKYLFKNEKTIGYKLFGLGVINMENETNPWYVPLIKTLFEFVGLIGSSFFIYMFAPFNGGYGAMLLPFDFGLAEGIKYWISLGGLILVTTILTVVVNSFGLFTHYRQTLINLIFNDKVVDVRMIDLGDQDDKFEGRPY